MASLNKVILIGHLVADPELKQTQTGISVCSFRIGVQRRYKSQDGQSQADFIDIVTWRQQAEFVSKYFRKGKPICVVGSLQQRSWTDQQGQKRYTLEVVADELSFVEKAESSGQGNYGGNNSGQYNPDSYTPPAYSSSPADTNSGKFEDISGDDDLPF